MQKLNAKQPFVQGPCDSAACANLLSHDDLQSRHEAAKSATHLQFQDVYCYNIPLIAYVKGKIGTLSGQYQRWREHAHSSELPEGKLAYLLVLCWFRLLLQTVYYCIIADTADAPSGKLQQCSQRVLRQRWWNLTTHGNQTRHITCARYSR